MTSSPGPPATNTQPPAFSPARKHPLHAWRLAALIAIAVLVVLATAAALVESYYGLLAWAGHHGYAGWRARLFPLQIDVFIVVPELLLFVALVDGWRARYRAAPWLVMGAGLAVSVIGNAGHSAHSSFWDHATWAVPPLAAAAALTFGLTVVKRVTAAHSARTRSGHLATLNGHTDPAVRQAAELFGEQLAGGHVPGQRALRRSLRVGQPRAKRVQRTLAALTGSHPTDRGE